MNWTKIRSKAQKPQVWYLNDHAWGNPRFRIDSVRGSKVIWKERTNLKRMEETKHYMEKAWPC